MPLRRAADTPCRFFLAADVSDFLNVVRRTGINHIGRCDLVLDDPGTDSALLPGGRLWEAPLP